MRLPLRLLGATVVLIASLAIVGCAAGIVGVWMVRREAAAKVETLTAQLDRALERASASTRTLHDAMETVRGGVRSSKVDPVGLEPGGYKNREVTEFLNTVIQRLGTFSELAPTASALLRNLRRFPISPTDRLTPESLDRAAARAARLSATARSLRETFDPPDRILSERELIDAATEVDRAVETCEAVVAEWQSDLDAGRAELPGFQSRLRRWLTLTAVAATCLAAWVGVSQISLIAHARRFCRDRDL